jgi:4-amino-4-deoxy-L-arabinose transferase-like glycosyltransferase
MMSNTSLKKLSKIWLLCLILASIVVSLSHFKSESNDSKYYTELVVRYHNSELRELVAPKWGKNYWSFDPNTYMRDQFQGQLFMGVALTKLGIPADQALHVLGMFFQVGAFLILMKLIIKMDQFHSALFVVSSLLLTPLAFSYNLRANHELGIMFFSFLSLYAGFSFLRSWWWCLAFLISAIMIFLIKGPFFIFAFTSFFFGYFYHFKKSREFFIKYVFVNLVALIAVVITVFIYEKIFVQVTGESFLREFWRIQIEERAMGENHQHIFIIQKFINFWYYFSHYLVYSLPVSLILLVYLIVQKKYLDFFNEAKKRSSLMLLFASMVFCLFFSMSDRVAGRYAFAGYFLFSAWIALILIRISPKLSQWVKKHSMKLEIGIPAFWLFSILLHFWK